MMELKVSKSIYGATQKFAAKKKVLAIIISDFRLHHIGRNMNNLLAAGKSNQGSRCYTAELMAVRLFNFWMKKNFSLPGTVDK